jgi:hypothetical protein
MYDLVLDPSRLPDINNADEGLQEYLYDNPGESYRETINLDNYSKLDNKTFFKKNNIFNFAYQKNSTNSDVDNNLDISVILLIHGGNANVGTQINKQHQFWDDSISNRIDNPRFSELIGIKANTVRMYNDIGFNVKIIDNIYKIIIGVFYFNSFICLILLFLQLNLFRSKINNKVYPYKKLYTLGRQYKAIPNPLNNVHNNSDISNTQNDKDSKYKRYYGEPKFQYYIPNINLALSRSKSISPEVGENYLCFVIKYKNEFKIYKFVLTSKNIKSILEYNNHPFKNNIDEFIDLLNISDMVTISYNTIYNKILPDYDMNNVTFHLSFDFLYCKGGLMIDDFVLDIKKKKDIVKYDDEFGYSYVGNFENCKVNICDDIKYIELIRNKRKKIISIDDLFKNIINLNFSVANSEESIADFIEDLLSKEKKLSRSIKLKLNSIFRTIQTLKSSDFINKKQTGSGYKKLKSKNIKSKPKTNNKTKSKTKTKTNTKTKTDNKTKTKTDNKTKTKTKTKTKSKTKINKKI